MGLALSLALTLTAFSLLMGILGNLLVAFVRDAGTARSEAQRARESGDRAVEEKENRKEYVNIGIASIILIIIAIIVFYLMSASSLAMYVDENPKLNLSVNLTCDTPHSCTGFVSNTPPLPCQTIDTKTSEAPLATIKIVYVTSPPYASDIDRLKQLING